MLKVIAGPKVVAAYRPSEKIEVRPMPRQSRGSIAALGKRASRRRARRVPPASRLKNATKTAPNQVSMGRKDRNHMTNKASAQSHPKLVERRHHRHHRGTPHRPAPAH
eukprot:scaffold76056_cov70-Phaeocystis_antarctica.AAC.15